MSIAIRFLQPVQSETGLAVGEIVLGDFVERFESPLAFWGIPQYERQWSDGLTRLAAGASRSCLITQMYDPRTANFIVWWPMYRDGGRIVVQNQVLFMDALAELFDPSDPYRFISNRVSRTEEGESVSEWIVASTTLGTEKGIVP
jgi:hypothetical protein